VADDTEGLKVDDYKTARQLNIGFPKLVDQIKIFFRKGLMFKHAVVIYTIDANGRIRPLVTTGGIQQVTVNGITAPIGGDPIIQTDTGDIAITVGEANEIVIVSSVMMLNGGAGATVFLEDSVPNLLGPKVAFGAADLFSLLADSWLILPGGTILNIDGGVIGDTWTVTSTGGAI